VSEAIIDKWQTRLLGKNLSDGLLAGSGSRQLEVSDMG
jgi:hypothetical protein